jgi:hypothetical protein
MMTGIACVIHDDLRSHRRISTVWVSLPARSNCNRNTTRRMFKNAAARILPRNCALALRRKRSSPLPPRRQARRAVSNIRRPCLRLKSSRALEPASGRTIC